MRWLCRCIVSGIDFKAGCIAKLLATCRVPLHALAQGKVKELPTMTGSAVELMEALLGLGADTETKENQDLKTLLHVACEQHQVASPPPSPASSPTACAAAVLTMARWRGGRRPWRSC